MVEKPPEEKLLSLNQVSKYLVEKYGQPAAISVAYLRYLNTMGGGPDMVKVGRRVGYSPSALDKWHLARCEKKAAKDPVDTTQPREA